MKSLNLRGEELRCIDVIPPGLLFDLADMTNEQDTMRVMSLIGRFLNAIVVPEDLQRYRAILYDTQNVLGITELSDEAGRLITEYAGRPTVRPSESPAGSDTTGQPSRVVSLLPAMDRTAETSSEDGPPAAS